MNLQPQDQIYMRSQPGAPRYFLNYLLNFFLSIGWLFRSDCDGVGGTDSVLSVALGKDQPRLKKWKSQRKSSEMGVTEGEKNVSEN